MKQCMKNKTGFFNYYYFCCCSILWKIWRLEGKKWMDFLEKRFEILSKLCVWMCQFDSSIQKTNFLYHLEWVWSFFLFFLASYQKNTEMFFFSCCDFFLQIFLMPHFAFRKFFLQIFFPDFLESFDVKFKSKLIFWLELIVRLFEFQFWNLLLQGN